MKTIIALYLLLLGASASRAAEVILPYPAFGPQVAAYKLIGKAWWQWDPHGDDTDREYPIKVVVFWNQTREETIMRHPVDRKKEQDFRYVEYSKAVEHMEKVIKDFKEAKLDATPMEKGLAELKKQYKATEAAPSNADKASD